MLHGATVSFPASRQPAILMRTMAEWRITTIVLVPQALQLFMNAIEREAARSGRLIDLGWSGSASWPRKQGSP